MKDYGREVLPSAAVIIVIRSLTWLVSLQVLEHPCNSGSAAPATQGDSFLRPVTIFSIIFSPLLAVTGSLPSTPIGNYATFVKHFHFKFWLKCSSVSAHNRYLVPLPGTSPRILMEVATFHFVQHDIQSNLLITPWKWLDILCRYNRRV
jgi:hypothetical protein